MNKIHKSKQCIRCTKVKPHYKCNASPDKLAVYCIDCKKEKDKEYGRSYNPENKLNLHLKNKYNISLKDYRAMVDDQNGRCAICGNPPQNGRLVVDHDHDLGTVRGLLCRTCNTGIGHLKDDIALLETAVQYLKNSKNKRKSKGVPR